MSNTTSSTSTSKIDNIERLKQGVVYSESEINEIINNIHTQYPNTSIKRVCAYGRVSTKQEEQESSLLTQHEVFKSYCEHHKKDGYVLVEEMYEQQTGTLITKRKMFKQIVNDAKSGMYDILLFNPDVSVVINVCVALFFDDKSFLVKLYVRFLEFFVNKSVFFVFVILTFIFSLSV